MIKLEITKINNIKQTHLRVSIGIFKLVYFKLKNKINIRFEISKGWD